jgi:hypothetical protein
MFKCAQTMTALVNGTSTAQSEVIDDLVEILNSTDYNSIRMKTEEFPIEAIRPKKVRKQFSGTINILDCS